MADVHARFFRELYTGEHNSKLDDRIDMYYVGLGMHKSTFNAAVVDEKGTL